MSQPTQTINLDGYGNGPLPWRRVLDNMQPAGAGPGTAAYFLTTVGPDGRPHSVGIGAIWHDGAFWVVSGPRSRKSRNLAANPACTLAVRLADIDLTCDCTAGRVTDGATLERIARVYRDGGWPCEVDGDAFTAPYSAPSAGPPPWYLYRLTLDSAVGLAAAEPYGATRWRFAG